MDSKASWAVLLQTTRSSKTRKKKKRARWTEVQLHLECLVKQLLIIALPCKENRNVKINDWARLNQEAPLQDLPPTTGLICSFTCRVNSPTVVKQ